MRLSRHPHDRAAVRRADDDWLARAWSAADTQVLEVRSARLRLVGGEVAWCPPEDAPAGIRVFLGERDGHAHFAVLTEGHAPEEEGWTPLRGALPALAENPHDVPLVFHALGLAEWHRATRFCPRCGAPLDSRKAGHELACTDCGKVQFPRTDPAVIMLVTHGEPGSPQERCLLGRHAGWPSTWYSTLAGFAEPGETLEDAVRREVAEEVGVLVGDVTYFGNQPWPFPGSLMLGFFGRALSTELVCDPDEIAEARWFTREELLAEATAGRTALPGGASISRSLVEDWYGDALPSSWR